MNNVNM